MMISNIKSILAPQYVAKELFRRSAKKFEKMDGTRQYLASATCLLFQLKYIKEADADLLFRTIYSLKVDYEFFIRKAIGWSLRELSKTNPEVIRNYVKNNDLPPLSIKEALKIIG